jgi:hypothetical protein
MRVGTMSSATKDVFGLALYRPGLQNSNVRVLVELHVRSFSEPFSALVRRHQRTFAAIEQIRSVTQDWPETDTGRAIATARRQFLETGLRAVEQTIRRDVQRVLQRMPSGACGALFDEITIELPFSQSGRTLIERRHIPYLTRFLNNKILRCKCTLYESQS